MKNELKKIEENIKKSDSYLGVGFAMMWLCVGVLTGTLIMYFSHKEIYKHYYNCQEQKLMEVVAELKTKKTWYIKEGADGKIKIVEMSKQKLDSLSK